MKIDGDLCMSSGAKIMLDAKGFLSVSCEGKLVVSPAPACIVETMGAEEDWHCHLQVSESLKMQTSHFEDSKGLLGSLRRGWGIE